MRRITLTLLIIGTFGYVLSFHLVHPLANRIIGGVDAKIDEVPYQLSLCESQINSSLPCEFTCGASIIGTKWAITAGHCVTEKNTVGKKIRVGAGHEVRNQGRFYDVVDIIRHKKYSAKKAENDIALLKININFQFSDKVKAVQLPESEPAVGLTATISGWGKTTPSRLVSEFPETLKKVSVSIIDRKLCNKRYSKVRPVSESMICAGNEKGGKDACQNDSGGPLVINNILYGIVSWGYGCGRPEYPGVYTNIAKYRTWIKKKIAEKKDY